MDNYVGKILLQKMILKNGIIDINFIPTEAYEFCYDTGSCKKYGIMITNASIQMYNIAYQNGITNIAAGPINVGRTIR
jgi:hypothetical protein